jgi:hypothetical protein
VFTEHETDQIKIDNEWKDYSMTITLKKFGLKSFDLENYDNITSLSFTDNFNNRIVSSFIMQEKDILVLFYLKSVDNPVTEFNNAKFAIKFYDFDLNEINEIIISQNYIDQPRSGEGIFFKGLYLKEDYASFIYYL